MKVKRLGSGVETIPLWTAIKKSANKNPWQWLLGLATVMFLATYLMPGMETILKLIVGADLVLACIMTASLFIAFAAGRPGFVVFAVIALFLLVVPPVMLRHAQSDDDEKVAGVTKQALIPAGEALFVADESGMSAEEKEQIESFVDGMSKTIPFSDAFKGRFKDRTDEEILLVLIRGDVHKGTHRWIESKEYLQKMPYEQFPDAENLGIYARELGMQEIVISSIISKHNAKS